MRDFGEILAENRKKKGYSQSYLVDLLSQEGIQVTTKALSKWETNAREPALHVFLTLCQLLDIEDIYESFFGENPYNIMSGLNEEGRNKLIEFADILKASKKFSPLSAKIIPYHHPVEITWEPVSAGTGNYLEDSVKETYDVGYLAPEQTDFGVRIPVTVWSHFIIQTMLHGFRKKILLLMVKLESSISTAILTSRNYTMSQMVFI